MDYEKKYKDALERARDVYTYYCDDREQLRKIESIFPELAESEDEKIRKNIISYLALYKDVIGEEYESWLAWLEKKDEQKPWSEEDLATFSRVISIVKWAAYSDHSHPILNDKGATELVERLNFIKDIYTWKPSDEQIMALRWVLNHIPYDSHKEEISGLLEQLKKLREE